MMFRQEGDMGRYVAFNDPGQPGAGFSSLEEYLAAGNQMPQLPNREPLEAANPLLGMTNAIPPTLNVTPPSVPISAQTPMSGLRDSDGNPLPNFTPIRSPGLPPSNNFLDDTRDKTLPQISDPAGLQKAIRTVNPIVSGPEEFAIASNQQIPDAGLFNRVGQQLIGYDDQFSGINDRLNKIEEGIASLIQNRGQGLNMNTGGLGYFFNPFGGFYG